jgi:hypothetical protein
MNSKAPLYLRTGGLGCFLLLMILTVLPTGVQTLKLKSTYHTAEQEIQKYFNEVEFPTIYIANQEARSNEDLPYTKEWEFEEEKILLHMDTSEDPDIIMLQDLDPAIAMAVVLIRDKLLFYNRDQNQSETLDFKDLPPDAQWDIDKPFLADLGQEWGQILFYLFILFLLFYHGLGKLVWWGILIAIQSDTAKKNGVSAYSMAVWSLVPATLIQCLFAGLGFLWILGFGAYFLIVLGMTLTLQKMARQNPPLPPEMPKL